MAGIKTVHIGQKLVRRPPFLGREKRHPSRTRSDRIYLAAVHTKTGQMKQRERQATAEMAMVVEGQPENAPNKYHN